MKLIVVQWYHMFDFHEKRKIRRVLYSKVSIALVFFLAFVIGRSVYERYTVEREMATKLNDRIAELEALKQRAALLEGKVEHLKDERGIEEELRNRFDVVKDGEQVVIILDEEKTDATAVPSTNPVPENEEGFFAKLRFW
jgi:cell division protein FtsB